MKKIPALLIIFSWFLTNVFAGTVYNIKNENGNTLTTCSGTLVDDGGINGDYGNNGNHKVIICSGSSDHIRLDFKKLALDLTSNDKIIIYDGNTTSSPIIATITKVNLPTTISIGFKPAYVSSGTCLTVVFTSDLVNEAAGFEAEISCTSGTFAKIGDTPTINGCSGFLTDDGGFSGNYTAGSKTTTICSNNNQSIRLDFLNTTGIHGTDSLMIYDGNSTTSPPLIQIGGTYIEKNFTKIPFNINTAENFDQIPVQSNSNCLTLQFNANNVDFGAGFVISYSCTANQLKIPGNFCATAPTICDLNKFEGITSSFYASNLPGTGTDRLCNGNEFSCPSFSSGVSVENNSWVAFIASATTASFKFTIPYCADNTKGAQIRAFNYGNCETFKPTDAVSTFLVVYPNTSGVLSCTGLVPGTKYIIVIDGYEGNICGYTIEATAGINPINAGPDQTTCKDTTTMAASGIGEWKLISSGGTPSIANANSPTSKISALAPGENKFKWQNTGACGTNSGDTVVITVTSGAGVTINYAGKPFPKTTAGTKSVTVSGGTVSGNYTATPSGLTINATTGAITPNTSDTGTYVVSVPTACGNATDTVKITTCPTITPAQPIPVCLDTTSTTFTYSFTGAPIKFSIEWDSNASAAGFTDIIDSTLPASPIKISFPAISTEGIYSGFIKVTDAAGCVSAPKAIAVTIKNCVCTPPNAPLMSPDKSYCDSLSILPLTATGDSITWYSDPNKTTIIARGNNYTPRYSSIPKKYYATQTKNGCESDTASVKVTFYSVPKIAVPLHINQLCPSLKGSVTLDASGGSGTTNWQFSKDNGSNFTSSNTFPNLDPGPFTFIVKDDITQCTKDTSIVITGAPKLTIIAPDSLCKGTLVKIIASGIKPYSWNSNTPGSDSTFSFTLNNSTVVTISDSCNTANPIQKTITAFESPSLKFSTDTVLKVCIGDSLTLPAEVINGSKPFLFTWSPLSDLKNITNGSNTTSAVFNASQIASFSYNLEVIDNCLLKDNKNIKITVLPSPEAEITADDAICENDTIFLKNIKHNSSITKYEWKFGNNNNSSIEKTQSALTTPGIYYVSLKVTNNDGCSAIAKDTFEVIKNPVTIINASATEKSIFNPIVSFDASNSHDNISNYLWDFAGLGKDSLITSAFTFPDTGTYLVKLNVKNRNIIKGQDYYCYDSTQIKITIVDEMALFIPNAFSPNDDGQNDRFSPKGVGFSKYEMRIFDRWGQEVFYSKNIDDSWNGNVTGSNLMANEDVYVYLITVKPSNKNEGERIFKGHVTLIR